MASQTPSSPVLSHSRSSDPLPEPRKTTQSPKTVPELFPINEQEDIRPSNPFIDPPNQSTDPQLGSSCVTNELTRVSTPPLTTHSPNPKPLHLSTLETAEEAQPEPSRTFSGMPCSASWKWPQGTAHPLKVVHYTLFFQAIIGFVIFVLVIHALRNLGWWTQRETAAGLASEFHYPLQENLHLECSSTLYQLFIVLPGPKMLYIPSLTISYETVTTSGATSFVVFPLQLMVGYVTPADTNCMRRIRTSIGTLLGLLLMGLYGAAGATMVKSPGKDFRKSFDEPPYGVWWTATILVFAQLYVCLC